MIQRYARTRSSGQQWVPRSTATFAFLALVVIQTGCAGGWTTAPAAPAAGDELVSSWMADAPGHPGKIIFMRNNTDHPVLLTSLRLYDCRNIREFCGEQHPETQLMPGAVVEVLRTHPERREAGFAFSYRFGWRGL